LVTSKKPFLLLLAFAIWNPPSFCYDRLTLTPQDLLCTAT
jgi:hypothetical protein